MKLGLALVFVLIAAAGGAAEPPTHLQDVPREIEKGRMERRDERAGRFDIEVDSLEPAGTNETAAKVRIRNLADFEISGLELTCTAFDDKEAELASTSWRLEEAGGGAMQPGETMTVTLRFSASSNEVRAASCNARGW
jgi:hypothetical protein